MSKLDVPFYLNPLTNRPLDARQKGTSSDRPTGNSLFPGLWRYETDTNGFVYYDGSTWQVLDDILSRTDCELHLKAEKSDIPTKVSDLTNDSNYLTGIPSDLVAAVALNTAKVGITSAQSTAIARNSTMSRPTIVLKVTIQNVDYNLSHGFHYPAFFINGRHKADLEFIEGHTYRFDQSDPSNLKTNIWQGQYDFVSSPPDNSGENRTIRFSTVDGGTRDGGLEYSGGVYRGEQTGFLPGGVPVIGIEPGNPGAYTEITITPSTPRTLYYYEDSDSGQGQAIWNTYTQRLSLRHLSGSHKITVKEPGELHTMLSRDTVYGSLRATDDATDETTFNNVAATTLTATELLGTTGKIMVNNDSRQTSIYHATQSNTSTDADLHIDTYSNSTADDMGINFSTQNTSRMRIAKNGDVNVAGDVDVAGNMDVGTINGGATTVSSLSTAAVGSYGYGPISGGTITASGNIETSSKLVASELEIAAGANGLTSHFNHGGNGKNYIRGTDTYCDTDFQIKDDKFLEFGNLHGWFLQSGVIWFDLKYAYTHNGSQQVQNELNLGFNHPSTVGSWSKLLTITGNKIHHRRALQYSSDDRLKHNETNIVKGLNIIRQLQPEKYQKTVEMYEADYKGVIDEPSVWEAGLIAQKVSQIPELTDYVAGGDTIGESGEKIENAYSLDYNSISMYSLASIKELDAIIQAQQSKIDSLQAENTVMKSKLNEILTEMGKETIADFSRMRRH